ncbi:MAG TPA: Calx-beta domain-containing protein [Solirubrobacteraceae bacterium]|jgi:hypothetical protein
MHRRAVRTLTAALVAALFLAPATARAYTITADPVEENAGEIVFTVQPEGLESPAVAFDPQSGTATEGADFDGTPRNPALSDGKVHVPIVKDDLDEDNETIRLVAPNGDEGTGTIVDDDTTALSIADATVPESDGIAKLAITASNPSENDITIQIRPANGTALEGTPGDFTAPPPPTLPAGETSVEIIAGIANDNADEPDETFTLTMHDATAGATFADDTALVTIVNDDLRVVDVLDTSTPEGDGGTSNAQFVVRLSAPTFRTVTVKFATSDGQAKAPADYLGRLGTVTFEPGQTSATVDVAVVGDDAKEDAEVFALTLSGIANARAGDVNAVGVIVDDDGAGPGLPGGGGGTGGPAPGADVTPPKMSVAAPKARGRRIAMRVACPRGEKSCKVRLSLFTVPDRRAKARTLRSERRVGRKTFTLRGGASKTVALTLPSSLMRAARRSGRLKLQAFAISEDAAGNVDTRTRRATLRYRKRK